MEINRRRLLQGLAGTAILGGSPLHRTRAAAASGRPDSKIAGVQIGVISYSFRSMPDVSAEAILRYCQQLGINAIELMGDPAEWYAGIPIRFDIAKLYQMYDRTAAGQPPLSAAEEQQRKALLDTYAEYKRSAAVWRAQVSMDRFKQLRRLYNDAGVSIYAFKPGTFDVDNTDAEIDYGMRAARALGANQVTVEIPDSMAQIRRLAAAAQRHGLLMAYHQHLQASPTLWDAALAESPANAINIDLGHYVAAGDYDAVAFVRQHHARIASMHLKDRRNRADGGANMPWGQGDTPLGPVLQLMRDQHYRFPAAIELEYDIPAGSDAVREVGRCLDYCRRALAQ